MNDDVTFVRAYVIHRRRHPEYVESCDACRRAKAFLEATTPQTQIVEIPFVHEPNNFGCGKSDVQWKREMRKQPCVYCGRSPGGTIDHKVPRYRGGLDVANNCVPSCRPCNGEKGGLTFEEFLAKKKRGGIVSA